MRSAWRALTTRLACSLGAQMLTAFGVTVFVALLVALISLSATRDATLRLANLQETQRRMVASIKDLGLAAELQSGAVQAFLLSGDNRYLEDQARGQARFEDAFEVLGDLTLADEGLDRLDEMERARQRFEASAQSQLALYRQGWQRSATFLWRTEGQQTKQELEQVIEAYRAWYDNAVEEDVAAAQQRNRLALALAITLIVLAALEGVVVGLRLTRSITHRLDTLTAAARAIERDDFSARAIVAGVDEVATLAGAMNGMAEHLDESQRALEESRQQLRESLEQYRLLADNAQDIIYALDRRGRFVYVNGAIEVIAGYKPEDVIGRDFADLVPPDLRADRREAFERRMRGEEVVNTAEIELLATDSRRVSLELRLATLERDGQIIGTQGIARDMTRRKAMEGEIRRLAEQEHERAEQLQQVARMSRKIARLTSLEQLLPNVANLLHELFGYERIHIFLLDPETRRLALRATGGPEAGPVPLLASLAEDQGIVGWVASHGRPARVADVRIDPRYLPAPSGADTLSELAIPIRTGNQTLGVLNIESPRLARFDENDEAMMLILVRQIATVIENARLFEQQHSLAVAEERNRLAREIHDTLAQGLTGITLQLEVADALLGLGPEQARPKIIKALELTRANLEEARRSVLDLRAAPLQARALPTALEELVGGFGREQEVRADFAARDVGGRLPSAVEAGLYRIAQEALTNVGKHADATTVQVTLERRADTLVLTVCDNGTGFDPDAPGADRRRGGFGLVGMGERARLLGGRLEVTSAPDQGTQIVVTVPAPRAREAAAPGSNGTAPPSPTPAEKVPA